MTNCDHERKREQNFPLGRIVITDNAVQTVSLAGIATALIRHAQGDWGDVSDTSRGQNEWALKHGGRLLSVYKDFRCASFWVMTETDRGTTTVLLPGDY
jgi:hypothetical protein